MEPKRWEGNGVVIIDLPLPFTVYYLLKMRRTSFITPFAFAGATSSAERST
jgi:hypothetical protein